MTALESVEQFPIVIRETHGETTRFIIALIATIAFFLLLGISLILNPSPFETVAGALAGPTGLIRGYYFGQKKPEPSQT